jgi:hypothetical protein
MFIPDPDLDFLPIADPGVKKVPDSGSGIRNTALYLTESVQLAFMVFIKNWQNIFNVYRIVYRSE